MDKKTEAMMDLLASQRNQALNAFVECAGELASAEARWDDVEQVRARLAELEGPPDPRSGE
jgi:hypothetical protein